MRIGVDVGGTHTDAVLVGKEGIASSTKVVTDHEDLLNSVLSALRGVLGNVDSKRIKAITLSTTLTTNALLEGKTDRVGVIVSSGPGVDPAHHRIGDAYFVIDGSIDHRGEERKALNRLQLEEAVASCRDQGIRAYAVATKFSTRTPEHELIMESSIDRDDADVISAGHRLSGALNFPRRITKHITILLSGEGTTNLPSPSRRASQGWVSMRLYMCSRPMVEPCRSLRR